MNSRLRPAIQRAAIPFLIGTLGLLPWFTNAKFVQQGSKLVGIGAVGTAWQGQSVFISSTGNTAIEGGIGDNTGASAAWVFVNGHVGVDEDENGIPARFALEQNYPNPFNPSTTITYEVPRSSEATLSVYDILGRNVSRLVNEREDAGDYQVKFDASNLASGVYVYRLEAGRFIQSRKLMLLLTSLHKTALGTHR